MGVRPETETVLAGVEMHHLPMLTDVSSTKIRSATAREVGTLGRREGKPSASYDSATLWRCACSVVGFAAKTCVAPLSALNCEVLDFDCQGCSNRRRRLTLTLRTALSTQTFISLHITRYI